MILNTTIKHVCNIVEEYILRIMWNIDSFDAYPISWFIDFDPKLMC